MVKKSKKPRKIQFELEDDAEELFRQALDEFDPSHKQEFAEDQAGYSRGGKSAKPNTKSVASRKLDLHGMTLELAIQAVDRFLDSLRSSGGRFEVNFITGKGRHSGPGGSVLPRGVHHHVKSKWASSIISVEESPADATINGMPIRGHFKAVFQF